MKIIVSFATEEFITPAHDEVIIRLSKILRDRYITGSFHLTGDYARKLRERRRTDVIDALKHHEIGYHSNTHGAYPFIGEICESMPWDDAVAALMRTESRGIMDIQDIFSRLPKYYVIEFVKAPQLIYALKSLGIDSLGFSSLPSTENAPFSWYCGSLCFSAPHMGAESPPSPNRLGQFKTEFDSHHTKASQGEHDGILKLFNHPYKFLYNNRVASWVSENQPYRTYDLHADWKSPLKSMYDKPVTDALFTDFEQLLDYICAKDDVEFMSTSQLMSQYQVKPPAFVPFDTVVNLSKQIQHDFTFHKQDGIFYSPAEILGLIVEALSFFQANNAMPETVPYRDLLGPVSETAATSSFAISTSTLLKNILRINREIDFTRQLPAQIQIESTLMSTAGLLAACVAILAALLGRRSLDAVHTVHVDMQKKLPHIATHSYFWQETFTKPSYPDNFTGQNICKACRLQSWTYKPAQSGKPD